MTAALLAAACVAASGTSQAQVPVVESNNRLAAAPPRASSSQSMDSRSEMFYQMQLLQQEVLELRGLLEEQSYELKRLKQQRLDDYVNLDRRISALAGGGAAAPSSDSTADAAAPPAASPRQPEQSVQTAEDIVGEQADEVQRYRTAIDLVLRKKDYAAAIVSFKQYLSEYPKGRYAPNSQYWLGEIYLLQGDLEQARQWFARLLSEHAGHAKAPDATYKLGTVYHKLGDNAKARQLLQEVAQGSTNAARLAASYLADMNR
ncbi:tol-pal system protein YbgF [Pseudomaricurvus alcaniphilus]|nr:tol-pal system protein YbgF [Pseudomaricurvus alcaniphilus]